MRSPLLTEEFFEDLNSSTLSVEEAQTLPPACYTDREFFEFEKEALFNHEWLCVGRESWVANPGDYFTTSVVGEPVVVVRTREGEREKARDRWKKRVLREAPQR